MSQFIDAYMHSTIVAENLVTQRAWALEAMMAIKYLNDILAPEPER